MRELTQEEFQLLQRHARWLVNKAGGEKADLSEADLSETNLYGADLRRAYLYGAKLSGAKNIVAFGPIGSRGDTTYAVRHANCVMIKCGCFWGDFEQWQALCRSTHGDSLHGRAYAAAADFIKAYSSLYWG